MMYVAGSGVGREKMYKRLENVGAYSREILGEIDDWRVADLARIGTHV